ncbi:hypothetical protein K439DRAFT_430 [Ramaria rubella]|nr:hypothetical protein K439DRAFT_430 [Ramaria rubella]
MSALETRLINSICYFPLHKQMPLFRRHPFRSAAYETSWWIGNLGPYSAQVHSQLALCI